MPSESAGTENERSTRERKSHAKADCPLLTPHQKSVVTQCINALRVNLRFGVHSQQSRSEIVNLEHFTNWATHASPLQRSIEPQCAWAAPSAPVPFRYRASSSTSPIIWKICGSICGSLSWLRHAWQSEAFLPLASRDTTSVGTKNKVSARAGFDFRGHGRGGRL